MLSEQQTTMGAFTPPYMRIEADEARENITRIKGILRGWNMSIDDLPDEDAPGAAATAQQSSVQQYPQTPSNIPQLKSAAASSFQYNVFIS